MPPDPPRSSALRASLLPLRANYISHSIQTKNLGIYVLATEQERVFIILNMCIQYTRVCLQGRLGKMLAETAENNILQLITLTEN